MTKYFESATMPDFFAKRYRSPALRIMASVIIFVFLVPYSASVYKGLSGLFAMAFGIDFKYCMLAMAVLTGLYVVLGGYMAAAINDFIQGIIMLVGILAVVAAVLSCQGGFTEAVTKLSQISSPDTAMEGPFTSFFGPEPLSLLSVMILTSLGTWGLPQMVHKFYTIKSEKAICTGTVISTVFALIIAGGSYFTGAFGRLFYTPGADGAVVYDQIIPEMLGQCLPDVLIGVVMVLVLSASMSTLSSLVIASSSTFTLDFLRGMVFRSMKPRQQMVTIRILCGVFVALSVLIAMNPGSLISSLMSLSWGALAGSFLGPFLYGLFWKGTTKAAVWASFVSGIGINALNLLFGFASPTAAGALSIVASLMVVPVVSLVTPKLPKILVEQAFSCYDESITAPHKFVLTEDETSRQPQ